MENLSKRFRSKPVMEVIEDGVNFLVVCKTCGAVFMKSEINPSEQNHITQLALRSVTTSHLESFFQQHEIDIVNLSNGSSTRYL